VNVGLNRGVVFRHHPDPASELLVDTVRFQWVDIAPSVTAASLIDAICDELKRSLHCIFGNGVDVERIRKCHD
jgi:hypothetical protein